MVEFYHVYIEPVFCAMWFDNILFVPWFEILNLPLDNSLLFITCPEDTESIM